MILLLFSKKQFIPNFHFWNVFLYNGNRTTLIDDLWVFETNDEVLKIRSRLISVHGLSTLLSLLLTSVERDSNPFYNVILTKYQNWSWAIDLQTYTLLVTVLVCPLIIYIHLSGTG